MRLSGNATFRMSPALFWHGCCLGKNCGKHIEEIQWIYMLRKALY